MKILLIFPPKTSWCFIGTKLYKKIDEESGSYPPLGLLYLASSLKKYNFTQVEIIDAPNEKISYPQLEEKIRNFKPDIVGVYFCTEYLLDSIRTCELVKKIDSQVTVIAGGPHIFIYPKETIINPDIDYCIYGEGEKAFALLVDALAQKKEPELVPGVISKKNIDRNQVLQKIDNLDELPFPDRRLLDINTYKSFITYKNPITTMMTSRGCAFNCNFCNNIERAQKVRLRSVTNIISEIEQIIGLGIRDIIFFDENFTFDIKRVEELCDKIKEKKLKVRWHCRSRADAKFDSKILKKMRSAGCRLIQLGIETGTQRLQKIINKKLDLGKVKGVVKMIKDAGILVYGNFMIGLPSETKEEMFATIDYASDLGLDYAPFGIFIPLPKSEFYENALKEGVIKNDYWQEYARNPLQGIKNYVWPFYSEDELNKINYSAFKKFYFRFNYLVKALTIRQSFSQKIWQLKSAIKLFWTAGS